MDKLEIKNQSKLGLNNVEDMVYEIEQAKSKVSQAIRLAPTKSLTEHLHGVSSLAFNTKTKDLASASFDNTINIYDTDKLSLKSKLSGHKDGVWSISYHLDKNLLASGGTEKSLYLWDTSSNKVINKLDFHDQTIYDVKFGTYNKDLLLSCSKGKIALWDIRKFDSPISNICSVDNTFVYSVNFLLEDKFLIYGVIDSNISIYDLNENKLKCSVSVKYSDYKSDKNQDSYNSIYSINQIPNDKENNKFISSHSDGSVRAFDYDHNNNSIKENTLYMYNWMPMTCAIESPHNKNILSTSKDHYSYVWKKGEQDKVDYILYGHSDMVTDGKFIDDNLIATSSYDQTVKFWNVKV